MRAAGCIMNDLADRHLDGHVKRTQQRPLVIGSVSYRAAIMLCLCLCSMAFLLTLTLNTLAVLLSIPAVLLAMAYPFMKRCIQAPQVVLGLAFSWGIPMAFAAETGHIPHVAWLLFLTNVLWTIAYDTEYAMVDRVDDLAIGIRSTAILFGQWDVFAITMLQLSSITVLLSIGYLLQYSIIFFACVAIAGILFIYQQHLIKHRNPTQCLKAFRHNQWIGLIVFIGIAFNHFF